MLLIVVGVLNDELFLDSSGDNKLVATWVCLGLVWKSDNVYAEGDACKVGICGSLAPRVCGDRFKYIWKKH